MDRQSEKKREWLLLFLILPFGVVIMFIVGQIALGQPATWRVQAEMNSVLDPHVVLVYDSYGHIEPVRAEIMTVPAWMDTFLTPPATNTPLSDSSSGSPDSLTPSGIATASPFATVTLASSPTPFPTATLIPTSTATLVPTPTIPPTPTYVYIPPTNPPNSGGGGGGSGRDGCECIEYAGKSDQCKEWNDPSCDKK